MGIKSILKSAFVNTLNASGRLMSDIKHRANGAALILAYHRVNSTDYIKNTLLKKPLYVSEDIFDLHLAWLTAHFKMVSLSEIINKIKKQEPWTDALCAITFDDGWYDNYEFALPVLKKYKVPSTIFIVGNEVGLSEPNCWDICFEIIHRKEQLPRGITDIGKLDKILCLNMKNRTEKARTAVNVIRTLAMEEFDAVSLRLRDFYYNEIDEVKAVNRNYRKLSWADMREMQKESVEFGYHSLNHPILTNLSPERLCDELALPLEKALSNGVDLKRIFSYPDGKRNKDVVQILKKNGFDGATSLANGFNSLRTPLFELKRFNIHSGSSGTLPHFMYNLTRNI